MHSTCSSGLRSVTSNEEKKTPRGTFKEPVVAQTSMKHLQFTDMDIKKKQQLRFSDGWMDGVFDVARCTCR